MALRFYDFVTFEAWPGLAIGVCPPLDFECKQPSDTGTTAPDGRATVNLPMTTTGFDGYLQISNPNAMPGVLAFARRPVEASQLGVRWPTAGAFNAMSLIVGVAPDPSRGHIGGNARDCAFMNAAGVTFSVNTLDADTTPFYFQGSTPDKTATQTDSATAIGGFANLPPGLAEVEYHLAKTGQKIGKVTVQVRAGHLTFLQFEPNL